MPVNTYDKILTKGPESALPNPEDGKIRFTTDTGRMFIDSNNTRVEITDFVKGMTEAEIKSQLAPLTNKIYIASDTGKFFVYDSINDTWNNIASVDTEARNHIDELGNKIDGEETVYDFAPIITIEDAIPVNADVTVKIDPKQDLHGYDKPWVGGAGKNKLNYEAWKTVEIANGTATWENNGVTLTATANDCFTNYENNIYPVLARIPVSEGETIIMTWDTDATNERNGRVMFFPNGSIPGLVETTAVTKMLSYIVPSGVNYISFRLGVAGGGSTISYSNVMIRKSGDDTFEPYENICPISGWDNIEISRTGKNLCSYIEQGAYNFSNGSISALDNYCRTVKIMCKPNTTYTMSYSVSNPNNIGFLFWDKDNNYIGYDHSSGILKKTTTTPNNAAYLAFNIGSSNTTITPSDITNAQLELGENATTYEPYNGDQYTIDLNGTRYGGILHIDNNGNVDFIVDRKIINCKDIDFGGGSSTGGLGWYDFSDSSNSWPRTISNKIGINWDGWSSSIPSISYAGANSYSRVYGRNNLYADGGEYENTVVCYYLANPFTIKLSSQSIQLLKGQNTIYANSGDIKLTYYTGLEDSIANVQKQVNDHEERIEAVESGLTNQTARSRSNITSRLTNLATAVAEQNLEKYGYKIGDYFTGASGYIYYLADMDTFYGGYDINAIVSTHHISLVVKTGANSKWAETNDTSGGYKTSTLHSYLSSTVLDNIKSDMIALFGGSTGLEHLVSHKLLWTTATSAWAWSDNAEYISALSEPQVYGTNVWAIDGYQTGEAWKWLEIFHKFNYYEILGNIWWWLRSISSASHACFADIDGFANHRNASDSSGAVGLIMFH